MQTIDAIRRTNELSKVLKQHGFAEDSFEAVGRAHEMTSDEPSRILEPRRMESSDEHLAQKIANLERSKHLLAGRVDQLQAELAAQKEAHKQVLARLDGAESRLRHLRNQPAAASETIVAPQEAPISAMHASDRPQEAPFQVTSSRQEPSASSQGSERPRHPRQAAMDEKFAIENVFYCGVK